MKYRNVKTGAVINASGKVSGENWVEVPSSTATEPVTEPVKEEKTKKKTTRK